MGKRVEFTVKLNGTDKNPLGYGVKQNPFPEYGYTKHILHLQALGGEPIKDVQYIRDWLKGWSEEFIELCCSRFVKGQMIEFDVYFNDL